jgi:hypothetical protein
MKLPFVSRRASGEDTTPESRPVAEDIEGVPGWVNHFRRWGVPAAAILVLVLCAPGEQHLGDLAGWGGHMSWGLSGLFTLYAGLAAVISTQLPQGARGKTSSVWGAFLSLMLAMAAQPVSHLFVTHYISVEPRPPLWLVVTVSSVPPLILGHLLHFAAMGAAQRPRPVQGQDIQTPVTTVTRPRPRPVPSSVPVSSVTPVSRPAVPAAPRPALSLVGGQSAVTASPGQQAGQNTPSLSARALSLWEDGTDEDKIKEILRAEYTVSGVPPKTNSVTKAVTRAQAKSPRP